MTEFTEDRRKFLGASEIAAVMGLSKWCSPRLVWEDKLGKREREETLAMRLGKFMEPFILAEGLKAAKEKGYDIQDGEANATTFLHPKFPQFGATPDGFGVYEGQRCTLETKFANDYMSEAFGHEGSDQCPDEYVVQVVWQMLVTGCKYGFLFALLSNRMIAVYMIDATDSEAGYETRKLASLAIQAGLKFWNCVEDGVMPALTGQECDTNYAKEKYSYEDGSITNVDETEAEVALEYLRVKTQREQIEMREKELKNQLVEVIGEAAILETPYGEFTRKADKNGQRTFRAPKYREVKNEEAVLV